jgi:hypothetical protein
MGGCRVALTWIAVLVVACGSASGGDLFSGDSDAGTAGKGGSGGQVQSGGTGGVGASGGSGGQPVTGGSGGSTAGSGGSTAGMGGGPAGSGGVIAGTGGSNTDPGTVACGDSECDSNQFCCMLDNVNPSCRGDGSECSGSQLDCDDSNDCTNGQRCCGRLVATADGKTFLDANCRSDCPGGMTLCSEGSSCSDGRQCLTSTIVDAYRVCL